jgi:signal transduction histidine kinase
MNMNSAVKILLIAVFAIAINTLLGWGLDNETMKAFVSGYTAMNPTTAVLLIAVCISLIFQEAKRFRALSRLIVFAVAIVALIKILAFLGYDAHLDEWIFTQRLDHSQIPNRMAPNTAAGILSAAIAAILSGLQKRRAHIGSQCLALILSFIGLFSFIGYLYNVAGLYKIPTFIPMALNTSTAFVLLSLAIFFRHPKVGFAAIISSESLGGFMARRVLPSVIGLPLLIGVLRLHAEMNGYFSTEFGVAVMTLMTIILLTGLIVWNAKYLNELDQKSQLLTQRLERSVQELTVSNKELESFSYSVSHDLRAPLRSMSGLSKILLEDYDSSLDGIAKNYLERIHKSGLKMSELIDGLLDLARVTRHEINPQKVNLSEIARNVISDLQRNDPERKVTVSVSPNLIVHGDATLLSAALTNLLQNAWKFTGKKPNAEITFSRKAHETGDAFFVRDNGAGFDMQYSSKLFGAFQRLHSSNEFEGTGVGLATVQRIIQRHGGRLWAEAQPDIGATFYFQIS